MSPLRQDQEKKSYRLQLAGVWIGAAPYLLFIPVDEETDRPAGPRPAPRPVRSLPLPSPACATRAGAVT